MHIIHGELRKAPYIKPGCGQDGQSTMFIVELSEVIKDRQTGENTYTNYSAAIFAKSPAQIGYYTTSLVEGNFIVVNCEKLKVDVSESNGKQYIKLQMENARLEGINNKAVTLHNKVVINSKHHNNKLVINSSHSSKEAINKVKDSIKDK